MTTYALLLGEVQASVAKFNAPSCSFNIQHKQVSFFFFLLLINNFVTCSIFAMRLRTWTKTFLTSRETVEGEGMWIWGRPVFINFMNPRSLTISMGAYSLKPNKRSQP